MENDEAVDIETKEWILQLCRQEQVSLAVFNSIIRPG